MIPRTIVVPLDGSSLAERAVTAAAPLTDRLDVTIELLTTSWLNDTRSPRDYLDRIAGRLGGSEFTTVLDSEHHAVDAIQHVVEGQPETMVCMTTHGRGRFRWSVLGSVAEEVINQSRKPLLLVGPRGEPCWDRDRGGVVVCVDRSAAEAEGAEIAEACEWAKRLGVGVTLAHVSHPLDPEEYVSARAILGALERVASAKGVRAKAHMITSSSVAGSLADFADECGATMFIMLAHGRRGLARVALGSVTMGVVNAATCPVLVLPPSAS